MPRAYVGLGANLEVPALNIQRALEALACIPGIAQLRASSLFRSAPLMENPGGADQPDYCNAACEIETALPPRALLDALLAVERQLGRRRDGARWQPRVIDLDLLLYGDALIEEPGLRVPHPEMHRRNFVLAPLLELAPALEIPGRGPAHALLAALGREGLSAWAEA